MRREYGSQGKFVSFDIRIPLQLGGAHRSTLVVAEDSYARWQQRVQKDVRRQQSGDIEVSQSLMTNWGIDGVWAIGIATYARFKADPRGARGFIHIPGASERKDILVFSGNADLFETSTDEVVDRLSELAEAVATDVGADFDGPHPIFLHCGDRVYRLYKEEAPVAKTA
ncbi:MAG: hypothetical protein AAB927_01840 [Patescibacteria group bacterium]